MKYGKLPGVDKKISRIVQGTASFKVDDPDSCYQLMDLAMENGINAFDHAHCYGREKEKIMGDWLCSRGVRDEVVILAKGAHPYGYDRVTPEDIASDIKESMETMGVDYFDLYVLHRDDPKLPVGPIVETLTEHSRAGRIGAFGGSNWTHQRIAEANAYAKEHDLIPFTISSPNFSLAEQVVEPWGNCISIGGPGHGDAQRYYADHKDEVAIFSWSSLAGGFFSGQITRDNSKEIVEQGGLMSLAVKCYAYEQNFERYDRAAELAEKKGLTVPEVALAYVMNSPMNVFALTFSANEDQFKSNVGAVDIELTPAERSWLNLDADTL